MLDRDKNLPHQKKQQKERKWSLVHLQEDKQRQLGNKWLPIKKLALPRMVYLLDGAFCFLIDEFRCFVPGHVKRPIPLP
jgi:hypothetical protein